MFSAAWCSACNNKNTHDENQATEETTAPASTTVPLPNMVFDIEHFGERGINNNHPLSTSEQQRLQVGEIDQPLYQNDLSDFKYYLLKEIYKDKEGKILLLSRTSEMEAFAWLATYDTQEKLVDYQTVYYDEWAESLVNNTSIIRDNCITLRQYQRDLGTGRESIKTKVFQINGDLKFKELHAQK